MDTGSSPLADARNEDLAEVIGRIELGWNHEIERTRPLVDAVLFCVQILWIKRDNLCQYKSLCRTEALGSTL